MLSSISVKIHEIIEAYRNKLYVSGYLNFDMWLLLLAQTGLESGETYDDVKSSKFFQFKVWLNRFNI